MDNFTNQRRSSQGTRIHGTQMEICPYDVVIVIFCYIVRNMLYRYLLYLKMMNLLRHCDWRYMEITHQNTILLK